MANIIESTFKEIYKNNKISRLLVRNVRKLFYYNKKCKEMIWKKKINLFKVRDFMIP